MSIIGPRPQTRRCFDAFPEAAQREIVQVRPGLSGVGSIVFRGEEELYADVDDPDWLYDHAIMPYKGELERWYVRRQSLKNYFRLIALTAWVVVFPRSRVFWRVFRDLPEPPEELAGVRHSLTDPYGQRRGREALPAPAARRRARDPLGYHRPGAGYRLPAAGLRRGRGAAVRGVVSVVLPVLRAAMWAHRPQPGKEPRRYNYG